ncbi:Gti1/Pac2 family-domain-containing protein [Melampsora americana]|nr:Gti1/Pac2 family-domain-containing protein [Melampsora americana]
MNPNHNNHHTAIHHHHQQAVGQVHHHHHPPASHPSHPSSQLIPHPTLPHSHPRTPIDSVQHQQNANLQSYKNSAQFAFHGYIQSTHDALIIFQGCRNKKYSTVTRRLHERERRQISSGSVYVFDEGEAGIKRWTDGRVWSPSRILNNFLIYREIDQKRPTPSTSSASSTPNQHVNNNNTNTTAGVVAPTHPSPSSVSNASDSPANGADSSNQPKPTDSEPPGPSRPEFTTTPGSAQPDANNSSSQQADLPKSLSRDVERSLVGSLTTTYKFKEGGLVKKTISLDGMHMISYYKVEDVIAGRLRTPSSHPENLRLPISDELLKAQNFRVAPVLIRGPDGCTFFQDEGEDATAQAASFFHHPDHPLSLPNLSPHHQQQQPHGQHQHHGPSSRTGNGPLQLHLTQPRSSLGIGGHSGDVNNESDSHQNLSLNRISRPESARSVAPYSPYSPISPTLPTNLGPVRPPHDRLHPNSNLNSPSAVADLQGHQTSSIPILRLTSSNINTAINPTTNTSTASPTSHHYNQHASYIGSSSGGNNHTGSSDRSAAHSNTTQTHHSQAQHSSLNSGDNYQSMGYRLNSGLSLRGGTCDSHSNQYRTPTMAVEPTMYQPTADYPNSDHGGGSHPRSSSVPLGSLPSIKPASPNPYLQTNPTTNTQEQRFYDQFRAPFTSNPLYNSSYNSGYGNFNSSSSGLSSQRSPSATKNELLNTKSSEILTGHHLNLADSSNNNTNHQHHHHNDNNTDHNNSTGL